MTDKKFPGSWYVDGKKVEESYDFQTWSNKVSCKDNEHNFQFIEKVKKHIHAIPTNGIKVRYYYILYCTKCCCLIHLESPI